MVSDGVDIEGSLPAISARKNTNEMPIATDKRVDRFMFHVLRAWRHRCLLPRNLDSKTRCSRTSVLHDAEAATIELQRRLE
jgi:hypothetical protein